MEIEKAYHDHLPGSQGDGSRASPGARDVVL